METLRIYRPRVLLYGPSGMGQAYIASAALHSLEGYHVHNLDLGNLMSDSSRVCSLPFIFVGKQLIRQFETVDC